MRHLLSSALTPCLTLCLALLFAFQLSAQTEPTLTYPYNPDIDADQNILLDDLLELLIVYGNAFEVSEIMVDNQTLTEYLTSLNVLIEAIAMPDGTETGQFLRWDGTAWVLVIPSVGCTDSEACNYDPLATTNYASLCLYLDACGVCSGPGTIYECGCEDIPEGDCDCDGNQLDALNVCGGTCSADLDGDGICDDGDSCIGQADICGVCNGPGAIYDCGCSGIPEGDCDCNGTPDADGDGVCDTEDDCVGTLDAAGVCNGDCELDADGDGICDDDGNDTCDGTVDACGVCNGPGPIYECGCADMAEGACDCAGNTPDQDGNCQDCLSDTDGDGLYDDICGPCLGETSITYNGVVYGLVEIGGKCWFKENLRTTSYNSGTPILYTPDEAEWNDLGDFGGYSVYDNDNANTSTYGLLYNGYASVSPEGICPTYYNVPTLEEWDALIAELGGEEVAGGAMKESGLDHWASPNTGATNSSGFTALPGGGRSVGSAGYVGQTLSAEFWAKGVYIAPIDHVEDYIQAITISNTSASIADISHSSVRGHSIRCLRADVLLGCTDFNYMEYNPDANADDGSCAVPAVYGCMDPLFVEYDPLANVDDGSWCHNLIGCADGDVVEYNGYTYPVVTIGNQCWFQENLRTESYRNGVPIPNVQDPGEWQSLYISQNDGWVDYNNNNSYGEVYGKLYNGYVVLNDNGLCPNNYHVPSLNDFEQLVNLGGGNDYAGSFLKSEDGDGTDTYGWYYLYGGTNLSGFTGLPAGQRQQDGDFNYGTWTSSYQFTYFWSSTPGYNSDVQRGLRLMGGSPTWVSNNSYAGIDNISLRSGCSVRCMRDACNGQGLPEGDCDCSGNQLDVLGVCGGTCYSDEDGNGVCDDAEILGCMNNSNACNYNPSATQDDGSCAVVDSLGVCGGGCFASDEDGDGICDDVDECVGALDACGVCNGFGAVYECGCENIPEGDCDCNGNQEDILGVCGGGCSADTDEDGICDDIDDCVGELDTCGVCNGPGEAYECGCNDIPAGDCDCAGNQEDVFGVCGGGCLADADGDGVCDDIDDCVGEYDECGECNGDGSSCAFSTCGDDLLYEGHVYATVEIGGQCWFAENCHYLPSVSPSSSFDNSTPYYYVYGYEGSDVTSAKSEANYDIYGALYNWSAIMQPGICPSGWHIPSDAEWSQLTTSLGGASVAGEAMKSTSGWNNGGNGSNSSGFNALPGGIQAGNFSSLGSTGYWWSSSAYSSTQAWYRYISESNDAVNSAHPFKRNGSSARCVID